MKLIGKEEIDGKTVLITETEIKRFLRKPQKIIRKFIAIPKFNGAYFQWLEFPDNMLVPDNTSCQLDAWRMNSNRGSGK